MAEMKVLRSSVIARCPKRSLLPRHFRDDGTCRCDERPAAKAELAAAQTALRAVTEKAQERVRRARGWLEAT